MTTHLSDDMYIKNRILTIQRPELDHLKTGFMTIKSKTHIIKNVTPYYCAMFTANHKVESYGKLSFHIT